jgi:hypothetical protein
MLKNSSVLLCGVVSAAHGLGLKGIMVSVLSVVSVDVYPDSVSEDSGSDTDLYLRKDSLDILYCEGKIRTFVKTRYFSNSR